jgi:hypothetical protein
VRPEFFTDPVVARLSPDVRLTYIGLWCVADDAGFLVWDEPHIAAMLYPYESVKVRTRRIAKAGTELTESGRIVVLACGCARIPTLESHQKIGGNKSFTNRDKHRVHTFPDLSPGSNGSNGTLVAPAREALARRDEEDAAELARVRGLRVAG